MRTQVKILAILAACIAGTTGLARAELQAPKSTKAARQAVGLSILSGEDQGAVMDGARGAPSGTLQTSSDSDNPCMAEYGGYDKEDELMACLYGYNVYNPSCLQKFGVFGKLRWACDYGYDAREDGGDEGGGDTGGGGGGGGGGSMEPLLGLLTIAFALSRRQKVSDVGA